MINAVIFICVGVVVAFIGALLTAPLLQLAARLKRVNGMVYGKAVHALWLSNVCLVVWVALTSQFPAAGLVGLVISVGSLAYFVREMKRDGEPAAQGPLAWPSALAIAAMYEVVMLVIAGGVVLLLGNLIWGQIFK